MMEGEQDFVAGFAAARGWRGDGSLRYGETRCPL